MKIRWRLAWYGVGLTAAVLALFIILITALLVGSAGDDQDELLAGIADDAASSLATVVVGEADQGNPLLLPDGSTSDQPFTTIYDEAGQPVHGTATVDGVFLDLPAALVVEALDSGHSEATIDGMRTQVRRWDDLAGESGVVAASQAVRVVDEQIQGARGFFVVFAIIALIAPLVGAWFMSGRALAPVRLLARTTDEIGETGDLTRRLPPVEREDEVGVLTKSFNSMLDTIESATSERDLTIDAQQRFIADASHELRSPLTSILANAGFLLERHDANPEDRLDATEDIRTEANRMSELVERLLTLARADASGAAGLLGPVDVAGVIASVQRRARNLELELTVSTSGDLVVDGDAHALAELLWILVDNADKHGGARASITAHQGVDEVIIVVTDNGHGINEADREAVFDRFHRSDSARSGPGHGLGLSIADTIARNHGGSIQAGVGESDGASFTVRLPASGGNI